MIQLGSKVKDSLTGFAGIAISRTEHLYGCVHIGVQPETMHEGKLIPSEWFDEQRLDVVEERLPAVSKDSSATSGGPSLVGRPPGFRR